MAKPGSVTLKPIVERAAFEGGESLIYAGIGKAYALVGDREKQVEWFQKAIDWHLSQGETTEIPHRYYQYAGLPEEALARFQKQLENNPSLSNSAKVYRLMKIGLLQAQLGKERDLIGPIVIMPISI